MARSNTYILHIQSTYNHFFCFGVSKGQGGAGKPMKGYGNPIYGAGNFIHFFSFQNLKLGRINNIKFFSPGVGMGNPRNLNRNQGKGE